MEYYEFCSKRRTNIKFVGGRTVKLLTLYENSTVIMKGQDNIEDEACRSRLSTSICEKEKIWLVHALIEEHLRLTALTAYT